MILGLYGKMLSTKGVVLVMVHSLRPAPTLLQAVATRDGANQRVTGISAANNAIIYIDSAYANRGCSAEGRSQNNTYGPTFQLPRNTTEDPGFADYRRLNLTLLPSSPIFKRLPGFKQIPFNDIGLAIDCWRPRIPTDAETGRLALAPGTPGGPPARH